MTRAEPAIPDQFRPPAAQNRRVLHAGVGPLSTMHDATRSLAISSMSSSTRPLAQNSKIPERQTVLHPRPSTAPRKNSIANPQSAIRNHTHLHELSNR